MRKPTANIEECVRRREDLRTVVKDSALIIPAHSESVRNHDVHHSYRQDSNLFYLSGFEEPESVLIIRPGMTPESVLFVRKKDVNRETWDGFRYGPEAAKDIFKVDETYEIDEIEEKSADLLKDVSSVYYSMFRNSWFDPSFEKIMLEAKRRSGRSGKGVLSIKDVYPLIGEMRLKKSEYELAMLRSACSASAAAHVEMMCHTKPGISERELHGRFIFEVMKRGCAREGYGSIVATGNNACTLHYVFNDDLLKDGDLLLVDAGGEYNFYSADITRTWPVSGQFSEVQKRLYQKLLTLQKKMIAGVQPGVLWADHQHSCIEGLVEIMQEEKLLKGSRDEIIEKNEFRKYYPHGLGHYLGMDVHDAGAYELSGQSRSFEAGMVLTIEPGIYIPHDDDSVPEELRGIGIRIEDNILVTASGQEVLTPDVPKEIADMESLIGTKA